MLTFLAILPLSLSGLQSCPTKHKPDPESSRTLILSGQFQLFVVWSSTVKHRKKPQNVESSFDKVWWREKEDKFDWKYAIRLETSPARREAIAFVLASMLGVVKTGTDLVTSLDSKTHGFDRIQRPDEIGFISYSKVSTPESRFKSLPIRLLDSLDRCGRKVNPQRKVCGFKCTRIRVDGAWRLPLLCSKIINKSIKSSNRDKNDDTRTVISHCYHWVSVLKSRADFVHIKKLKNITC